MHGWHYETNPICVRLWKNLCAAIVSLDVQMRGLSRGNHSGEADVITNPEKLIEELHEQIATLRSENNSLHTKIEELEDDAISFGLNEARMHDAICEGRRQDAIDILNEVTGGQYRSVREQANLFPGRVAS